MSENADKPISVLSVAAWSGLDVPPRRRRGVARIELSQEPVTTRGEELGEIWWRGKQWAVTAYGIERLDGTYNIGKERLLEKLTGDHSHPWPLHMASKWWVDADEFATAWMVGILLHGHGRKKHAGPIRECFAKLPPVGGSY